MWYDIWTLHWRSVSLQAPQTPWLCPECRGRLVWGGSSRYIYWLQYTYNYIISNRHGYIMHRKYDSDDGYILKLHAWANHHRCMDILLHSKSSEIINKLRLLHVHHTTHSNTALTRTHFPRLLSNSATFPTFPAGCPPCFLAQMSPIHTLNLQTLYGFASHHHETLVGKE